MLDELFHRIKELESTQIDIGTIGHEGRDDHFELGDGDNDGFTLVFVTLYRGKRLGEPVKDGLAQGQQIVCQLSSLAGARIPAKGTRVLVAFPRGMDTAPGTGVVIATIEKTASKDQLQKDRVVIDYGPDTHVVIKGKSVSISDHDNRFIGVGTPRSGGDPGLIFQAADGTGGTIQEGKLGWFVSQDGDAKTVFQMTPEAVECMSKLGAGPTMWKINGDGFYTIGNTFTAQGAVYLGNVPTAATAAAYGPPGPVAAMVPRSLSVFVSPT